jgi:hypothetical protein
VEKNRMYRANNKIFRNGKKETVFMHHLTNTCARTHTYPDSNEQQRNKRILSHAMVLAFSFLRRFTCLLFIFSITPSHISFMYMFAFSGRQAEEKGPKQQVEDTLFFFPLFFIFQFVLIIARPTSFLVFFFST